MGLIQLVFRRLLPDADFHGTAAAGSKRTPRLHRTHVRRISLDGFEFLVHIALQPWYGSQKTFRLRMASFIKDLAALSFLHDLASIHDNDLVADLGNHAKVMRNENDRHSQFLFQIF